MGEKAAASLLKQRADEAKQGDEGYTKLAEGILASSRYASAFVGPTISPMDDDGRDWKEVVDGQARCHRFLERIDG